MLMNFGNGPVGGAAFVCDHAPNRCIHCPRRVPLRGEDALRASQTAQAKPVTSSRPHPTTVKKSSKPTQVTAAKSQSDADAKWKAAQEKATVNGVETLNQKDIEGLSLDQIKQLRDTEVAIGLAWKRRPVGARLMAAPPRVQTESTWPRRISLAPT